MKASIRDYGTADHTTHDLAIARAERDAWQSTCEELHRTIAGRDVEIESHLGRCEAADQRARSLDAALTAEREASKGLVAQVEALRTESKHYTAIANHNAEIEAQNATLASERDAAIAERDACAYDLRAIRDLVAPGNPQGTVVDAVRARLDAVENAQAFGIRERDAAIARAEKAESDLAELTATRDRLLAREHEDGRLHAQLRAELAELRARPVLTEDLLRGALDAHGHAALTRKLFAHLGPVTLPSPDRAEELAATLVGTARASMTNVPIAWSCDFADGNENARRALTNVVRTALANLSPAPAPALDAAFLRRVLVATKHGPNGKGGPGPCDAACVKCEAERMVKAAPAREVAPTLVAVSDEELAREHEDGRLHAQLRVELAELRARPVLTVDMAERVISTYCDEFAATDREGRTDVWAEVDQARRDHAIGVMKSTIAKLGAVTLPAQDRAEELTAAIYGAVERAERAMTPGPWEAKIYTTHVAGTSQETQWHEAIAGGPSSGTVVCETEWSVFEDESAIGAANIRGIVALRNAAPALIAEVRALRAAAEEREAELMAKAAPAREVAPTLVAVSEEELACAWFNVHGGDVKPSDIDDRDRAHVRAVLARLDATTIAPVDPEAVARAYHASEALPDVPSWTEVSSFGRHYAIAAMRATLTAAGIPVTPEAGK